MLAVEEDVGLSTQHLVWLNLCHRGVVKLVPSLIFRVKSVGRVMTTASVSVVANHTGKIVQRDLKEA